MLILMMMMAANRKQQQQHHHHRHHQQQQYHQNQHQQQQQSPAASATAPSAIEPCTRPVGKSSNSSNETVIALIESPHSTDSSSVALSHPQETTEPSEGACDSALAPPAAAVQVSENQQTSATATTSDCVDASVMLAEGVAPTNDATTSKHDTSHEAAATAGLANNSSSKRNSRFRSFFLLTTHLNPFHHTSNNYSPSSSSSGISMPKRKSSMDELGQESSEQVKRVSSNSSSSKEHNQQQQHRNYLAFFNLAYRYFGGGSSRQASSSQFGSAYSGGTKSAPVTPVKWQPLEDSAGIIRANGCKLSGHSERIVAPSGAFIDASNIAMAAGGDDDDGTLDTLGKTGLVVSNDRTVADITNANNHRNEVKSALDQDQQQNCIKQSGLQSRPSVRFSESICDEDDDDSSSNSYNGEESGKVKGKNRTPRWTSRQHFADQAVQTSSERFQVSNTDSLLTNSRRLYSAPFDGDETEVDLVARLFPKYPSEQPLSISGATTADSGGSSKGSQEQSVSSAPLPLEQRPGECPMNSERFRQYGYSLIDYISNYLDTIDKRRVTPLNIEPGYLKSLIQPDAPEKGESFANIMHDFENHIMCGITHWQHPHFHAYFPAGNAYPSILADMLSDALGCVGFSWAASPAYTELEIIMLDWMGKMIGLPDEFLCLSGARNGQESKGGGVIQGSASECVLVNLLAARHCAIEKLRKKYPNTADGMLLSKLIGYCSKEAHSCVEKAAMIGFIRMRALDTDEKHSLRGETLSRAMASDRSQGLEPFLVCATLGTTSCVSFDNLEELGQICKEQDTWMHVDAAYAGSALICPEFKYLIKGIEMASSFNMNPNKWMLINFDCSLMWVKDRFKLTRAFVVDPLYLQHSYSDQAIDYRHWGIPLSRRFRALKLWFVIRNYGVEGLQAYIRNHVKLAKLFEQLVRQDPRFIITNEVVLGLVCFRLIGSNALNQRLLSMINASGKLHMVPASLNGRYVIRFCVCDQNAQEKDIRYAYKCISEFASELFESIRMGKERIRAISQQNTIDVSSISLHTQQSASADRLNNMTGLQQQGDASNGGQLQQQTATSQQQVAPLPSPVSPREAARQYLMRRNSRLGTTLTGSELLEAAKSAAVANSSSATPTPLSARASPSINPSPVIDRSPLMKQASVAQQASEPQLQQQTTSAGAVNTVSNGASGGACDEEDLEQEIILDSLATIDGYDYDLDDDDLLEPPYYDEPTQQQQTGCGIDSQINGAARLGSGEQQATGSGSRSESAGGDHDRSLAAKTTSSGSGQLVDTRSPVAARRWHSRTGRASRNLTSGGAAGEHDEADDEVFTLTERRNRMSLRYKREFFVRVVSDPRVYRASISGDINAHASCCSLGGNKDNNQQQQAQQQPTQLNQTLVSTTTSVPSTQLGPTMTSLPTDEDSNNLKQQPPLTESVNNNNETSSNGNANGTDGNKV